MSFYSLSSSSAPLDAPIQHSRCAEHPRWQTQQITCESTSGVGPGVVRNSTATRERTRERATAPCALLSLIGRGRANSKGL
jgi:hypothetical protein